MAFALLLHPKVSVPGEPSLGHLCYILTDVPPQPNSPSDDVLKPLFSTIINRGILP